MLQLIYDLPITVSVVHSSALLQDTKNPEASIHLGIANTITKIVS